MSLSDRQTGLKLAVAFAGEAQVHHRKIEVHSRLGDFDETARMAVGGHAGFQYVAVRSESAGTALSGSFTRDR